MKLGSIPSVIGLGLSSGAAALLFWLGYGSWPGTFVLPYVLALVATAACGLLILLATYVDSVRNPRRGVRIRPIRGFDVSAGLLLAVPSIWALRPFLAAF